MSSKITRNLQRMPAFALKKPHTPKSIRRIRKVSDAKKPSYLDTALKEIKEKKMVAQPGQGIPELPVSAWTKIKTMLSFGKKSAEPQLPIAAADSTEDDTVEEGVDLLK